MSERHAEPRVRLHGPTTCVKKAMGALGLMPREDEDDDDDDGSKESLVQQWRQCSCFH